MTPHDAAAKQLLTHLEECVTRDGEWEGHATLRKMPLELIIDALEARERAVYQTVMDYIADEINHDRDCSPQTISAWCRHQEET